MINTRHKAIKLLEAVSWTYPYNTQSMTNLTFWDVVFRAVFIQSKGCTQFVQYDHRPSHPYYAGTEHVGFSPTRQTFLETSAKLREVFGESQEG